MNAEPRGAASAPATRALAVAVSAAVVLGSPVAGGLRGALLTAFPVYYRAVIEGAVAAGTFALAALCVSRIRAHRWPRYGALILALALGAGSAVALRTGDANVDAVEAFHFVEYSAITLLFYRVYRRRPRWEALALAGLAGVAVGTLDEWVQWFVPGREGELHDVLFDVVAVGCGLLLCLALAPWDAPHAARRPGAVTGLGVRLAGVLLLASAFVATVHLGHEIRLPDGGAFRSRFSEASLRELAADRSRAWGRGPLPIAARYGREDQYLTEALWHVRRRNKGLDPDRHGDPGERAVAWRENRILETYFAPVLEAPPRAGAAGHRLPEAQRVALELGRSPVPEAPVSDANPYPIYLWRAGQFWSAMAVLAAAITALAPMLDRRLSRTKDGRRSHA